MASHTKPNADLASFSAYALMLLCSYALLLCSYALLLCSLIMLSYYALWLAPHTSTA